MDEDDIYGGLDVAAESAECASLKEQVSAAATERGALEAARAADATELARLRDANATLERNISVLYNTAKGELARKDRQIADLTTRLDRR